eukprot:scaffold61225_cov43-Prasinocladus_malaysianus.AAC.1
MDGSSPGGAGVPLFGNAGGQLSSEPSPLVHRIPGIIIAPVGIVFMIYALVQHRLRTTKILSKKEIRYDDQIGPFLLVLLLLLAS